MKNASPLWGYWFLAASLLAAIALVSVGQVGAAMVPATVAAFTELARIVLRQQDPGARHDDR